MTSYNILPDFENEMASTRRMLERVPADKLDWRPTEKSGTLGWMASHVATLPQWGTMTLTLPDLKLEDMQPPPPPKSPEEMLEVFDKSVEEFRMHLRETTDEAIGQLWTCSWNGQILIQAPRFVVLRGSVLNHMIHHRAQLSMYFRMVGVPVPGMYGPSADEQSMFAEGATQG